MKEDREDIDSVLSGTTLKVYRALISLGRPAGPRELQRLLGLSSPSLVNFHLEKLERSGLVSKTSEGVYLLNRVYLKHYVRVRRLLIPRYAFHSSLATIFLLGWVMVFIDRNFQSALNGSSQPVHSIVLLVFLYGLVINVILASIFWFETVRILSHEKI